MKNSSAKILPAGAILLTSRATIGESAILTKSSTTNQGFQSLIPTKINNEFLYYLKYQFIREMYKKAFGSTFLEISKSNVEQINIKIPANKEQEKIADMLSLLDKKIELQTKKVEVLKLYKKCLLHLLFAGEGKKNILNDICDFINGKGHESFIDEDGKYILVNSKFISTNGSVFKKTNKSLSPLKKDSITMVMSDLPNGKALAKCFYIEEDNKYTLNQRICSLFVKDEKVIDSKFLFYLLDRNKNYLKFDDGVNQTNLKKEDVLDIVIRIPKLSYQIDVANILFTLDRLVQYEQNKNDVISLLKKGLIQSMFV